MERLEIGFIGVIAILALIGIRVPIGSPWESLPSSASGR